MRRIIGNGWSAMISEAQIQDRLFQYLARQITLNDFEDWLARESWNMHLDSDEAAQALVGAIELRLAEYSADHLTDDALERELKGLLASTVELLIEGINGRSTQPRFTTASTSESFVWAAPVSLAA
jgi:hypothetical protein